MKNQKAIERDRLILEFGILLQPLGSLCRREHPPAVAEYRLAIAQVQGGDPQWRVGAKNFTTFSDDLRFNQEYQDISHVPERLWQRVAQLIADPDLSEDLRALHEQFRLEVEKAKESFLDLVDRVPVTWEPMVFEANTPFTAYLRIRAAISAARHRIHYFDRYLKAEFFRLFLDDVSRSLSIRLITTATSVKDVSPVSELFRKEFADYELIQVDRADLHDRNLRVDEQVFTLGPGVDRAGVALTNFGPADSSNEAHLAFNMVISGGRIVHKS